MSIRLTLPSLTRMLYRRSCSLRFRRTCGGGLPMYAGKISDILVDTSQDGSWSLQEGAEERARRAAAVSRFRYAFSHGAQRAYQPP